jgi:hypothetical protein
MRQRLISDNQTHFSKEFYKVGGRNYLTDFDAVQILDTENKSYSQFGYIDNKVYLKRIIEVKYKATEHIRGLISGEIEPIAQIFLFASVVSEINGYRRDTNLPAAQFYYLIQTEGDYPYYVYDISNNKGSIKYTFVTKVEDTEQLRALAKS